MARENSEHKQKKQRKGCWRLWQRQSAHAALLGACVPPPEQGRGWIAPGAEDEVTAVGSGTRLQPPWHQLDSVTFVYHRPCMHF